MSIVNNQTDIYTAPTLEPNFNWQAGLNNFNSITPEDVQFRVTIRPLTSFESVSRIPSPIVAYEETGVYLNDTTNLGLWQFTFAKNLLSTGGPYRNYQVVVEAHDNNGNTSAGNMIGTNNENGWTAYPNGYDIIAVNNPRPSGIELSFNLPTQLSSTGAFIASTGNSYTSVQYMGSNGEIIIRFNSGTFPSGIVGGFLYTSTNQFPKIDIFSDTSFYGARVEQTQFAFDVNNPFIYSPHAAFNVRGAPYCYVSVSFFDELDQVLLNNGVNIATGLYVSNNAPFYNDGAAGSLTMGGVVTFYTVQTTGYPLAGSSRWSGLIGSGGVEIARVSTDGTLNVPVNITTIFYMSPPLTGLYSGVTGGLPGGGGGNSTNNVTGKQPGGFGTGTLIAVGFDNNYNLVYEPITGLTVGQTVVSFIFPVLSGQDVYYDPVVDNWQTTHCSFSGLIYNTIPSQIFGENLSGFFGSGVITQIGSSIKSGFINFGSAVGKDSLSTTFEQPLFLITGTNTANTTGYFIGPLPISGSVFHGNPPVIAALEYSPFPFASPPIPPMLGGGRILSAFITESTGTFYYLEVKPFNTFFIGSTFAAGLAHNSIFNY